MLGSSGTNLSLHFETQTGVNYLLERAASLELPVIWTPVFTNAGDGAAQTFNPPFDRALPGQFFRIVAY